MPENMIQFQKGFGLYEVMDMFALNVAARLDDAQATGSIAGPDG